MLMRNHSHLWPGVPYAVGAAILFGATTPLAKFLLGTISPWMLAGIFYFAAGLGLLGWRLLRSAAGNASQEAGLRRAEVPWLLAVVIFGGLIGPVLLMFGLTLTTAGNASLLLNLEGLATMLIAWIVFRENVDRCLLLGAAAILCGAVVLSWDGSGVRIDMGAMLIAGACLAWGIDNNLTRKLSAADPVEIAMVKGLVAGSVNLGLAASAGAGLPPPNILVLAGLVGLFGIGVSLVMFMLGLRHLGAARTGAYFSLAPFIGAVLAIVLLGEAFTWQLGLAGILMMAGTWLHVRERHEHFHTHAPAEHEHMHAHDAHHQHAHATGMDPTAPHSHPHRHAALTHSHVHFPDIHHRHEHE